MQHRFILFTVVAAISITASYSICYSNIQNFSDLNIEGNSDVLKYLRIYNGGIVESHYRYRVLVPFFAKALPNPPKFLFDERRPPSDLWIAKIKFGIVNFFFLALTGILFFYYLKTFGLSTSECLMGILFFYTARPIMQNTGLPLDHAANYFFILLCLYAIRCQKLILLIIGFSLGIFAKETILITFPAIFLSQFRHKFIAAGSLVPALATYLIFRFYIYPNPSEDYFRLQLIIFAKDYPYYLVNIIRLNKILDLFSSFGLLWIFAIYALFRYQKIPLLLKRFSWLIIIILAIIVMLQGNLGYILFMAFPVVIPLAIYGISACLYRLGI